jgi:tRNA(Ile)-lysidine synthase
MNRIQLNISLLQQFPSNQRYLIGVSGGRDSVALLDSLVDHGFKNLVVCHLNHQLRGRASAADERFVEKLAAKYDVHLEIGSANVRALAAKRKLSIETAAREARYKFFVQIAKRRKCRRIFLAHHADDLVETFLINLFRGAGLSGLAAMRPVSVRKIDNVQLTILRPLLGTWRAEIDDYVRKHGLRFREDASNNNLAPLRNRVRRRIVPYLEKAFGRNIRQSLWRTATIVSEEESWIDNQLRDSSQAHLSVKELRDLPVALQRRQILKWLRAQDVSNIGFDVVEHVRALLDHDSQIAKTNLPQDRHVRRRAGKVFLE